MAKGAPLPAPLTPTPDLGFIREAEQGRGATRRGDLCGVPSERRSVFPGVFPELHSGLVCDAPSAHGVGHAVGVEAECGNVRHPHDRGLAVE
jgi:hypothetical protein